MKPFGQKPRHGLAEPAGWTIGLGVLSLALCFLAPQLWALGLTLALIYLAIGLAAWQEIRLAAVIGMWLFIVASILRVASLAMNFSWSKVGMLLVFIWLAWEYRNALRQWREAEEESAGEDDAAGSRPMISIALFLGAPRYLEAAMLARIVENAWDGDYTSGDEEAQDGFVVGESPVFMVKSPHGMFMIHNQPTPYFDDAEAVADEIGELRLRRAILEHRAWLAVDLVLPFDDSLPREAFYPLIIRLIYELVEGHDDDVLAVFRPESGQINVWAEDVLEVLLMPDGQERFNRVTPHAPVISIEAGDPEMMAAEAEARERWPEFEKAFRARETGDHFAVKAEVTVGEVTEFIWIEVTGLEPAYVHGKLGNEPVALEGLTLGSVVEVPLEKVSDWCVVAGGRPPVGMFTVKVVEAAQQRFRGEKNQ